MSVGAAPPPIAETEQQRDERTGEQHGRAEEPAAPAAQQQAVRGACAGGSTVLLDTRQA